MKNTGFHHGIGSTIPVFFYFFCLFFFIPIITAQQNNPSNPQRLPGPGSQPGININNPKLTIQQRQQLLQQQRLQQLQRFKGNPKGTGQVKPAPQNPNGPGQPNIMIPNASLGGGASPNPQSNQNPGPQKTIQQPLIIPPKAEERSMQGSTETTLVHNRSKASEGDKESKSGSYSYSSESTSMADKKLEEEDKVTSKLKVKEKMDKKLTEKEEEDKAKEESKSSEEEQAGKGDLGDQGDLDPTSRAENRPKQSSEEQQETTTTNSEPTPTKPNSMSSQMAKSASSNSNETSSSRNSESIEEDGQSSIRNSGEGSQLINAITNDQDKVNEDDDQLDPNSNTILSPFSKSDGEEKQGLNIDGSGTTTNKQNKGNWESTMTSLSEDDIFLKNINDEVNVADLLVNPDEDADGNDPLVKLGPGSGTPLVSREEYHPPLTPKEEMEADYDISIDVENKGRRNFRRQHYTPVRPFSTINRRINSIKYYDEDDQMPQFIQAWTGPNSVLPPVHRGISEEMEQKDGRMYIGTF